MYVIKTRSVHIEVSMNVTSFHAFLFSPYSNERGRGKLVATSHRLYCVEIADVAEEVLNRSAQIGESGAETLLDGYHSQVEDSKCVN